MKIKPYVSDGPIGSPHLEPITSSKHGEESVVLTCNNPDDDGNPDCDIYTWKRIGRSDVIPLPSFQTLEFLMEENRAGNYTCTCGNNYNTSDVSNIAEVIFLIGPESCRYICLILRYIITCFMGVEGY